MKLLIIFGFLFFMISNSFAQVNRDYLTRTRIISAESTPKEVHLLLPKEVELWPKKTNNQTLENYINELLVKNSYLLYASKKSGERGRSIFRRGMVNKKLTLEIPDAKYLPINFERSEIPIENYIYFLLLKDFYSQNYQEKAISDKEDLEQKRESQSKIDIKINEFHPRIPTDKQSSDEEKRIFENPETSDSQIEIRVPSPPKKNSVDYEFTNYTLNSLEYTILNLISKSDYNDYLKRVEKNSGPYHRIIYRIQFIQYIQSL